MMSREPDLEVGDEFFDEGEVFPNDPYPRSDGFGGGFGGLGNYDLPLENEVGFKNKIISSGNKNRKIIFYAPKVQKYDFVAVPVFKNGKIFLVDGKPVIKRVVKNILVYEGSEKREIDFPIDEWFNDSGTSSILSSNRASLVMRLDDMAFRWWAKSVNNPNRDYTKLVNWLAWMKASILDTSKSIHGVAIEKANTSYSFHAPEERAFLKEREGVTAKAVNAKKGGLLGGSFLPGLL
jgi:hypothetical protein